MSGLDDAFHKLERGKEHLVNFTRNIKQTFDEKSFSYVIKSYPYTKRREAGDQRPWTVYTAEFSSVPAFTKYDGLFMGEVIQNFRSALDYLAWAYYVRSGLRFRDFDEKRIDFPMTSSQDSFKTKVNQLFPKISANERALLERYQPYQPTDAAMKVGWLQTLSNTDKHRIILPTVTTGIDGYLAIEYGSWAELQTVLDRFEPGQDIKEGTKIQSLVLAGTPPIADKRPVYMQANTAKLAIVLPVDLIRARPPYEMVTMYAALNGIRDVCTEILVEAKKYF